MRQRRRFDDIGWHRNSGAPMWFVVILYFAAVAFAIGWSHESDRADRTFADGVHMAGGRIVSHNVVVGADSLVRMRRGQ